MTLKILILLTSILLLPLNAYSEAYKWINGSGQAYYGDSKHKSLKSKPVDLKDNSYAAPVFAAESPEQLHMYATSWCGYCKKARRYFRQNDIPYREYDIERDSKAKARYNKLGGNGVPLILYGKKRMTGFSEGQFKRLYN